MTFVKLSERKCMYSPSRGLPCAAYVRDHTATFRVHDAGYLTRVDAELASKLAALWARR
jgi:hypothetical protein